jgi:hypothetical protein
VRSGGVVVGDPGGDELASLIEIDKQAFVEQFLKHAAVAAFDIAVLHRLAGARCNAIPLDYPLPSSESRFRSPIRRRSLSSTRRRARSSRSGDRWAR